MKRKTKRYSSHPFNYAEEGFTLLELVVTLTILTIIVVLAFGAFRLGIKAWETGDERVDFFYRMKYLVDLMEKEISSGYPYYIRENNEEDKTLVFQGKPNFISFMSSIERNDRSFSPGNLRNVTFSFEEDNKQLIMTEEIIQSHNPLSKTSKNNIRSIVLSNDISDLKFKYFILKKEPAKSIHYEGVWLDNFLTTEEGFNNETLPRAIEVTMAIETQKEGINKTVETFYLPPFIILLNAGMEFKFN